VKFFDSPLDPDDVEQEARRIPFKIMYLIFFVRRDKSCTMSEDYSFVSVGNVIKKIHEARPDLDSQQIIKIIRAATFDGKIDEDKAAELAKTHL